MNHFFLLLGEKLKGLLKGERGGGGRERSQKEGESGVYVAVSVGDKRCAASLTRYRSRGRLPGQHLQNRGMRRVLQSG